MRNIRWQKIRVTTDMIKKLISWSIKNKWMVIVMYTMMIIYGIYSVINTPVDAIPDLPENQVIIYTEWMGRNPQIEDQITYPLTSNLQGIPKVKNIGASMFGMSFVFIIFEDEADDKANNDPFLCSGF